MSSLNTELQFYKQNKADLVAKFEGRYVVIVGKTVVGDYDNYRDAVIITAKTYKPGTFFVQLVTAEDEVATISRVIP